MAIFQSAVLNNYLNSIDDAQVEDAWSRFTDHFHNPEIQENIRNSKEEEYQDGFLSDLFVNVLGYTKYPAPGYNLKVEQRDEKGSKKADGALYVDDKVVAIIELKGTDTTNLEKVESQAFGYKVNHRHVDYVIISNFEKLRFYIDNAVEHIEFNLFNLTKEEFKILWLCLEHGNVKNGLPKKIKESSLTQNEEITKKLYADYSAFKDAIFKSIVKHNPDYDKLHLFKKTQKLLDRFLFIFFAEDQQLLPANSIKLIITEWQQLRELDEYRPLYERFVKYFGYLNVGRKTPGKEEIFPYNGGLFAEDEILDNISLDDEILYKHTLQLSKYNFASEVDVNILGHIFEHSLNEIEEITAELEGQKIDRSKTRRKKDGVYYTPKYITQYIVENTVGKLCEEKKEELQIDNEEYRPNRQKSTKKKLLGNLETYREWLLKLTICDPACGSGAFLNQALEFLLNEHHYIDELQAKLLEESIVYPDIEASILENNLYGVDINEESVEIAKLSLWLRTAQKGRKLTSLNNNIKCGNSLIDDPEVAGEKAFKWEEEFPSVFKNGGFDVVIGNPPYVKRQNISEKKIINHYEDKYESATYNFDLYLLFIEKGSRLIKSVGVLSYINPSKFTSTKTGTGLRNHIEKNCHITRFVDFKEFQVFENVTTYCCILFLKNKSKGETEYFELNPEFPTQIQTYNKTNILIEATTSGLGWRLAPTIEINGDYKLKDFINTFTGIESGADKIYILESDDPFLKDMSSSFDEIVFPLIKGANVGRYYFEELPYRAIVPYTQEGKLLSEDKIKNNHRGVWEYLKKHEEDLRGRENGKMDHNEWYGYVYPKNLFKYEENRVIWTDISIKPQFTLDTVNSWHVRTVCSLALNKDGIDNAISLKALLALLNSNLLFYYIQNNSNSVRGGYWRYKPQYVKEFPIVGSLLLNLDRLELLGDRALKRAHEYHYLINNVSNLLLSRFEIEKLNRKLQSWHELTFKQFLKELKKKQVKLSLEEETEWMEYFNRQKAKADELKTQITQTDKEIDDMVYELYGLSEEEVRIVESR